MKWRICSHNELGSENGEVKILLSYACLLSVFNVKFSNEYPLFCFSQICFEHRVSLLISWPKRRLETFGDSCCYESKSLAVLKGHEPRSILGHSQLLRVIPRGE